MVRCIVSRHYTIGELFASSNEKKARERQEEIDAALDHIKGYQKKTDIDFDWDSFNNGNINWLERLAVETGKMRANWKRRYFALWNSKLFYYFLTEKLCNEFLSGNSSNNQSRGIH